MIPDKNELPTSGAVGLPQLVLPLDHEQTSFLRECLEMRITYVVDHPAHESDPMTQAYLDGVKEEAESLLSIIGPCDSVKIFKQNAEERCGGL